MNVINIMWAGGSPFVSVHKVHQQILSLVPPDISVNSWLLQGHGAACAPGATREWNLPQRLIKGRHVWGLLQPWLRARLRKALLEADADALLLDGVGVSRLILPVLKGLPEVKATVVFHGKTRLHPSDVALLRGFKPAQLSLVAVSATLAASLQAELGLKVTALRTALEPTRFCAEQLTAQQARQVMGLREPGVRIMGAVGRLVMDKGFDYLIDAFAAASRAQPDLRLVILGEGPERPLLQQKIQALGLQGKVSLTGHCDILECLYLAFDWLLVPSRAEGLGLVLQEAVIAGVPVLCSDLPVFHEQLGDSGLYARVGDVQEWAAAIERCASLPATAVAQAQYRSLAPEQAWECFSRTLREMWAVKPDSGSQ
ncbi:glycosyltransferase [Pseudomonas sp. 1176_21]|uniref:glycosyltransferase n=1 Tax=Pseudomonas sp. 1176_21 TaxID=2604453 RepID=UPI000E23BFF7